MTVDTSSPEFAVDLLRQLDELCKRHNAYEFGLPLFDEAQRALMQDVVRRWCKAQSFKVE